MKLFTLPEPVFVDVRDLGASRAWYEEKLECRLVLRDSAERTEVFEFDQGEANLVLCEIQGDESSSACPLPILFTAKISVAHNWLSSRGVGVGPIQSDTAGNKFFRFRDLENNELEVCQKNW